MLKQWSSERLSLTQMGPHHARLVMDYGARVREFHAPWDPTRSADYWDKRVVADRLRFEVEQARSGVGLVLYLATLDRPDTIIGRVGISNVVRGIADSCAIGYGLAPEATGHGYMTEALARAIRIAIHDMGLHRVEVAVIPRNTRSLAVARRCGMREEGVSERFLKINGVWEDHVRFALTAEEIQ